MAVWRGQCVDDFGLALMSRRFPPPWSVEETDPKLRSFSRLIRLRVQRPRR
jgi:hypothetical protein